MPAYNADRFINRAVQSLAESTLPCDLYIVDDGSNNPVTQVLSDKFNALVLRLEHNCGIAHARNVGLQEILKHPYEYVACLDADDVSYPHRIAEQVYFLDSHPEVAAVGVWGRHIEENSGKAIYVNRTPASPEAVKKAMLSNLAIVNSGAMIRADAFRAIGLYSERYPAAEDYEFFRRLSAKYAIANIPEILIDISISRQGISLKRRHQQLFDRLRIQLKYFEPTELGAWSGAMRTLFLFLVPSSIHSKVKSSGRHIMGDVAALFARRRAL